MIKHNPDPFLAQTSMMLLVLAVMYVLGGDAATIDQLFITR